MAGAKEKMRELCGDDKALPPQLFNGDAYCGVRATVVLQLTPTELRADARGKRTRDGARFPEAVILYIFAFYGVLVSMTSISEVREDTVLAVLKQLRVSTSSVLHG